MADLRKVVVLLGMHRSGTSLTMSMLHSLGVDCGGSLIPAGPGNEAGFWEHAGIVAVQEDLLAALGRVWHGPAGTHPLPAGWLETAPARDARARLVQIVSEELARTHGVWGFKDPRTARLLPLWQSVFAEAGAKPEYILSVRHPAAVCNSLSKRNGMDHARGQLAWLLSNLDGYRDAGNALRLVIDYDMIVADPRREVARLTRALSSFMDITADQQAAAVNRVLPSMRRSGSGEKAVPNSVSRSVHEGLQELARDQNADPDFVRLVATYRDMEDLFTPWIRDTRSPALDWAIRLMVRRKYR